MWDIREKIQPPLEMDIGEADSSRDGLLSFRARIQRNFWDKANVLGDFPDYRKKQPNITNDLAMHC